MSQGRARNPEGLPGRHLRRSERRGEKKFRDEPRPHSRIPRTYPEQGRWRRLQRLLDLVAPNRPDERRIQPNAASLRGGHPRDLLPRAGQIAEPEHRDPNARRLDEHPRSSRAPTRLDPPEAPARAEEHLGFDDEGSHGRRPNRVYPQPDSKGSGPRLDRAASQVGRRYQNQAPRGRDAAARSDGPFGSVGMEETRAGGAPKHEA